MMMRSESEENLKKKEELWKYLKTHDAKAYIHKQQFSVTAGFLRS